MADVAILGGGVIGLGIAWRVAQAGLTVTVVDPDPGSGASRVAAGMLAPVTEVAFGEEDLLALNLASAQMFPQFVAELEQDSGLEVGYRTCGTLAVASDANDKSELDRLVSYQSELGLTVEVLSPKECRQLEPRLAPGMRGGALVAGDHQVNPRRLHAALLEAARRAGAHMVPKRAVGIRLSGSRAHPLARGVDLAGGETLEASSVVVAMGAWSSALAGVPTGQMPTVRPVKGQILRLWDPGRPGLLEHSVRALVQGHGVYFVPRLDGEIVLGATVEERGFDDTVTAGGVHDLLRFSHRILPGLSELALIECGASLRPTTADNAPLIGATDLDGLNLATGHFRNGVLLTPITAQAILALMTQGSVVGPAANFGPSRFYAPSGGGCASSDARGPSDVTGAG
ncbi:MAG: glycine oxidase ThiO [Acidimicrobiales bacterium]